MKLPIKFKLPKIKVPAKAAEFGLKVVTKVKRKSPEICLVVGLVSGGAALVAVGYKTWKHKDVLVEDIHKIEESREEDAETRSEALWGAYKAFGVDTIKVYWLPISLATLSATCFIGGHHILSRRLSGAMASYAVLLDKYNTLNERIIDKYGIDAQQELTHGIKVEDVVDAETGEVTKKVVRDNGPSCSMYARWYDEGDFDSASSHWIWRNTCWRRNKNDNIYALKMAQSTANDEFKRRGWYKLNEAYAKVGLPPTEEGEHVGWVLGSGHDDFIDFGVFAQFRNGRRQLPVNRLFLDPDHPQNAALLDFNVDGCIDYIFKDIMEYDLRSYVNNEKRRMKQ